MVEWVKFCFCSSDPLDATTKAPKQVIFDSGGRLLLSCAARILPSTGGNSRVLYLAGRRAREVYNGSVAELA